MATNTTIDAVAAPPIPAPVKPRFPFLDLKAQYADIKDEIQAAVLKVLDSQHFILGPEVEALEKEVAQYVGSRFAIGCASGSDALLLALMALGVDAGDEIITTPFTFFATGGAIARLKARPVFVDIDPATFNIDVRQIEAVITPRTKAIMPVHLFGLTADMDAINDIAARHQLPVIEDSAQAIGSQYKEKLSGVLGTMACFSFFPSKNLGGAGDGGLITTNDAALADRLKILRVHGSRTKYRYEVLGINSRLDALQAAILRVKLRYLDKWAAGRRANAERYREMFETEPVRGITLPVEPDGCFHVYNQYTVRSPQRDALKEHLRAAGIPTEIYYPLPLHLQPAFAYLGHKPGDFPQSELASEQAISLPVFPEMTHEQQRSVVAAISEFVERQPGSTQN